MDDFLAAATKEPRRRGEERIRSTRLGGLERRRRRGRRRVGGVEMQRRQRQLTRRDL